MADVEPKPKSPSTINFTFKGDSLTSPALDAARSYHFTVAHPGPIAEDERPYARKVAEIQENIVGKLAMIPEIVARWLAVARDTRPADRHLAESAVRDIYASSGARPPLILWADNPRAMTRARTLYCNVLTARGLGMSDPHYAREIMDMLRLTEEVRRALFAIRCRPVRSRSDDHIFNLIRDQYRDSTKSAFMISHEFGDAWNRAGAAFIANVPAMIENFIDRSLEVHFSSRSACQLEARGLSVHDYLRIGRLGRFPCLDAYSRLAQHAGYAIFDDAICWLSDRLSWLSIDEDGRPHCENGPAIMYRGDMSIYAIGGVTVDAQVVMAPETQDVVAIRREPNAEVKRIRIERFGWGRYLKATNAKVLDARRNDVEATRESLMRTDDGQVVLVCACPSTARVYAQRVPRKIATCEQAQAWLSGGLSGRIIHAS